MDSMDEMPQRDEFVPERPISGRGPRGAGGMHRATLGEGWLRVKIF